MDLPLVFCLNPDTVIQPGVVEVMKTEMENASAIAVAGPRLVEADGSVYPSARNFPSLVDGAGHALVGLVWPNNRWTQRYKRTGLHREEATDVDWLSGAALFVRRTAFKEVGGFDERYFMYMEDVDLCWRLIRAGWRIRYVPSVTVIHFRGVSTDQHPYRFIVAHHKSLFRYHLRTSRGVDRLALPVVTAGLVLRTPVACLHRWLIGKRADHKSLRPRRAQGAGKVSR